MNKPLEDKLFNVFYDINKATGISLSIDQLEKLRDASRELAAIILSEAQKPAKAVARALIELDDRLKKLEDNIDKSNIPTDN